MSSAASSPKARFANGKTSQIADVRLEFSSSAINISIANERLPPILWPYKKLHVLEDWSRETPGIIGYDDQPDARLYIHDKTLFHRATQRLEKDRRSAYKIKLRLSILAAAALLGMAFLIAVPPLFKQVFALTAQAMPRSFDLWLGQHILAQMKESMTFCNDKPSRQTLQKLAGYLVHENGLHIHPQLYIIEDDTPNALTLPGDIMLVNTGLLRLIRTEDDLAAVMAHEMGHMVHRHPLQGALQSIGISGISSLIFGNDLGAVASVALNLRYSRDIEREADAESRLLTEKAGFNPGALGEILQIMEEDIGKMDKEISYYMAYFSSHPATAERVMGVPRLKKETDSSFFKEKDMAVLKAACSKSSN